MSDTFLVLDKIGLLLVCQFFNRDADSLIFKEELQKHCNDC